MAALLTNMEGLKEIRMAIIHLNANSLFPCRPVKLGRRWHVHRSTAAPEYKDLGELARHYEPIFRRLAELTPRILVIPHFYRATEKTCTCPEGIFYPINRQRQSRMKIEWLLRTFVQRLETTDVEFLPYQTYMRILTGDMLPPQSLLSAVISYVLGPDLVHLSAGARHNLQSYLRSRSGLDDNKTRRA